jgi:predicted nucleic acid-binding protein
MNSGATERWAVNASPVILLAKAGIIHLLPSLCEELVVSAGVLAEVRGGRQADAGREWLETAGREFLRVVPEIHSALAGWGGGAGEAEVITWALEHPGFAAVLADRAARKLAARHGIPMLGSLRVIVKAKERGLIPLARPALERLRGVGAYVDDQLIDRAIALAGET